MHEDVIFKLNEQGYFYTPRKVEHLEWHNHYVMNYELAITTFWYFTMYVYVKDYCEKHFMNSDQHTHPMFIEDCALAHINEREFFPGEMPHQVWWDAFDLNFSRNLKWWEWRISDVSLGIGVFFNVLRIRFHRRPLLIVACIVNFLMGSIHITNITERFGVDYVAYLQQAGAVYHGETNYTKLSSNQGPAYYAAGHLYHYLPFYWLH